MRKIQSILKKKNNEIELIFESGEILHIHLDTYIDFYLYEGKEVSEEEYLKIKEKEDLYSDKNYLMRILSNKSYSIKQIKDKLIKRKKSSKQIEELINYLCSINLLDDERYYQELVASLEYKGYGLLRIQETIYDNGLDYQYSNDLEREISRAENVLKSLIRKYQNYNFHKMKESIINSLVNLGYVNEVVYSVVKNINEDDFLSLEEEKLRKDYIKLTFKLTEKEKKEQTSKIINKLKMKGYRYHDIIKMINQGEDYE